VLKKGGGDRKDEKSRVQKDEMAQKTTRHIVSTNALADEKSRVYPKKVVIYVIARFLSKRISGINLR
jgi:hypothetical protein